jgi:hypothetical protein
MRFKLQAFPNVKQKPQTNRTILETRPHARFDGFKMIFKSIVDELNGDKCRLIYNLMSQCKL